MRENVERYLRGRYSEVEVAMMESRPQEWLGELWTMYLEADERRSELIITHQKQVTTLTNIGRDGRHLAQIKSAQFTELIQIELRKLARIERGIEEVVRFMALRKGDGVYRAALVEYLLGEISAHREALSGQLERPEDQRLWALLGDRE